MASPVRPWSFTPFEARVHGLVRNVPLGRVVTYGDVAKAVGASGGARAVGQVMRWNPDTRATPCHRVVRSDGTLGGYMGSEEEGAKKARRLREEGVQVAPDGRILGFDAVRWRP